MDSGKNVDAKPSQSTARPRPQKRSPEQLERKRAQDRATQRANRQRTQALLAEQERRINDLQLENELLRGAVDAAKRDCTNAHVDAWRSQQKLFDINNMVTSAVQVIGSQVAFRNEGRSNVQADHEQQPGSNMFLGTSSRATTWPNSNSSAASSMHQSFADARDNHSAERFELRRLLQETSINHNISTSTQEVDGSAARVQAVQRLWPDVWSRDSSMIGPLDQIVLTFVDSRQSMLRQGVPEIIAAGPQEPNMAGFLHLPLDGVHIVSQLVTELTTKLSYFSALPEQVAIHWLCSRLLRWKICSTLDAYNLVPAWAKPIPCQLEIEHPPWMDFIPWPNMRSHLVQEAHQYHWAQFFLLYPMGLSVNWPHDPLECVSRMTDNVVALAPAFERHICDLQNWSMGLAVAQAYPSLHGTYRVSTRRSQTSDVDGAHQD